MAKKKKFGMDDVFELTSQAATLFGNFKDAQRSVKESKETKSFNEGNKTNLEGAEGGASPRPRTTDYGMSQLNKRYKNTA